jgi:hypothetical protein
MFGHAVTVYYEAVFEKHAALFRELDVRPNNGLGDVYAKLAGHPMQAQVEADIAAVYKTRPPLAMVDSGRGITNLHGTRFKQVLSPGRLFSSCLVVFLFDFLLRHFCFHFSLDLLSDFFPWRLPLGGGSI